MSDKHNPSAHKTVSKHGTSLHDETDEHTTGTQNTFSPLARRFLWADSASSVERVIFWLGVLCVFLFIMDFIVHRHAYAPGEGLPGFYAIVGFVAFTIIVLGASQLRKLILRNENYYSPNSVDEEEYPEGGLERLSHASESGTTNVATMEDNGSQSSHSDVQSLQNNSDQGDSA